MARKSGVWVYVWGKLTIYRTKRLLLGERYTVETPDGSTLATFGDRASAIAYVRNHGGRA